MRNVARTQIRLLLLSASPSGADELRLAREASLVLDKLEEARVRADVRFVAGATPQDFPVRLRRFRPDFVQFSGHGERDAGVVLEDEDGRAKPLSEELLAAIFDLYRGVKCVVLNCCHSLLSASLISPYVPYVIGMKAEISDKAAIAFSCGFYQAVGDGESVESAFDKGRLAIQTTCRPSDAVIPELFIRAEQAKGPQKRLTRTDKHLIPSLRDLEEFSWDEFEEFSLRVVEAIYRGANLKLTQNRYSLGRPRHGEAHYILGIGLENDFQVSYRIWIELAQKNRRVGRSVVAQPILNAQSERIQKIILLTSSGFSEDLRRWIEQYTMRTGVHVQLLDGPSLIQQAHIYLHPQRDLRHAADAVDPLTGVLTLTHWYTLHPNDGRPKSLHHGLLTARLDRPIFLVTEARLTRDSEPRQLRLRPACQNSNSLDVLPWPPGTTSDTQIASPGEELRKVFLIWPAADFDRSISNLVIEVDADRPLRVERIQLNEAKTPHAVLAPTVFQAQTKILRSIEQGIRTWSAQGSLFSGLLLAPPGLGKSYLVSKIRRSCHAAAAHEIFVDCEAIKTDLDFICGLFRAVLPIPTALLDQDLVDPVSEWCEGIHPDKDIAKQLAQDLCSMSSHGSHIGVGYRLDIASAVITYAATQQPLAIIIEDLHKASPSLLSLLGSLATRFAAYGESRIFLFATSRPLYFGITSLRDEWLSALSGISALDHTVVFTLMPPSRDEARALLRGSILGLEESHANVIVESVGSTPYALREATLFLLASHVLEVASFAGHTKLAVVDPTSLRLAIQADSLSRATEQRLQLLFAHEPEWLRRLLLGGAAYGRRFPVELLLRALRLEDNLDLALALATCASWSVLSHSSESSALLEFDHDLVRDAVIALGPSRARTNIARAILDVLGEEAEPHLRSRLAYQADLAEVCIQATQQAKSRARAENRAADIVELNQLAIQVLDPPIAEGILSELLKTGDQHLIDPAILSTPAPALILGRDERLRMVLTLLLENIDCLAAVASGSSRATEVAITEARLLAEKIGDYKAITGLLLSEGRMWFERNSVEKAIVLHVEAEERFARLGCSKDSTRAENLIRHAICLRREGKLNESVLTLERAAKTCPTGNWGVLSKVRSNLGAVYLQSNWDKVRYHWEKEVQQASRRNLPARKVHALAGLSFIDLFEGKLEAGFKKAKEALEISEHLRLDGQILRLCLNLSVHSMMIGNYEEARTYLLKAEDMALRHGVGRRLWRVAANLATTEEALGSSERAFARDLQAVRYFESGISEIRLDGREILPLVNIVLRGRGAKEFLDLLRVFPEQLSSAAYDYALLIERGELKKLPGLLGNYSTELAVGRRLLLTE